VLDVRHELHFLQRVCRHVLELLLEVDSLGILGGSVHDGLVVVRRGDLVDSVLLVFLAGVVLGVEGFVGRLVLAFVTDSGVDALQDLDDAFEVVLGVTKRYPFIEIRLHS